MRNCIVMGAGRSGTSLLAGMLATTGYWVGDELAEPRAANPTGFFEDREVNQINEELLASVLPGRPGGRTAVLYRSRPRRGQRWLGRLPVDRPPTAGTALVQRIRSVTERTPFALKDPRFSYTLPVWRPELPEDTTFVCVFRSPSLTVDSMLREVGEARYLRDLHLTRRHAFDVWRLMYSHIVTTHRGIGRWEFVHYDQLLSGDALARLGAALDTPVDASLIDPAASRSTPARGRVPAGVDDLYRSLCGLAGHAPGD